MLENILGSKVKIRILRLFAHNDREYTLQEIVDNLGLSLGSAHPAIKSLENIRILLGMKVGRSRVYKLNRNHLLFKEMMELFARELNAYRDTANEFVRIVRKDNIENIILFGSVARGDTLKPGDIDLLIIVRPDYDPSFEFEAISRIEHRYEVHLNTIRVSMDDVLDRLSRFDTFIINALDEGKILYGDPGWLKR
ncbi:MAG: nucleotidyltransferase domain-containing protein [Candidatus Thermoplasmatota archaeon]|nr:nucleotidyltransferase domain-containing protein [Candidatus Thermoplasmatota archaeon]